MPTRKPMGFRLGPHGVEHGLALAPMAGNTNLPYRRLCRKFGAEWTTTEMVSSKALAHGDEKSLTLLTRGADEVPIAAQVFGSDPEILHRAAEEIERRGFHAVDLNLGCPVPKITGGGGGSSLLRDPDLAARCVAAMVAGCTLPVTAKIRAGWDEPAKQKTPKLAKQLEDAGAQVLTVHGRTREQKYSGIADLELIAEVVAAVDIPVLGNGDVVDLASAKKMLSTGVSGLAIGRGALGRPWLFAEILADLKGQTPPPPPSPEQRMELLLELGEGVSEIQGEHTGMRIMRRLAADFFRDFPGAAEFRRRCTQLSTLEDLHKLAAPRQQFEQKTSSLRMKSSPKFEKESKL